jgi:hypothetical protein
MHRLWALILLIVIALFVQNTCPHGFAGKTTVMHSCDQCTFKQQHAPMTDRPARYTGGQAPMHYPLFLCSLPDSLYVLQPGPVRTLEAAIGGRYADVNPAEILRPPRS